MEAYLHEFLNLIDNGCTKEDREKYLKTLNIDQLLNIINFSIEKNSLLWKNRMILQMVSDSPFSFWACDEQFIVKLWEAASTEIYGKNYYGKEFWRFVEKKERKKAIEDCLSIISQQGGRVKNFDNYYAIEEGNIGILTQSFSLYDDLNDKYLQGEIGLNIKLSDVQQEHDRILQEQQQKLNQFIEDCNNLRSEFTKKKNEILQKINSQADVSKRSILRQNCTNVYSYFNERIQQLLDDAMLDNTDLFRLQNEFYEEFDKLELSIEQTEIETVSSLSFVEEKSRVEKIYQSLFKDTLLLFDSKIKELLERANIERKKSNIMEANTLDERRKNIIMAQMDYESDMNQIGDRLKAASNVDRVLRAEREAHIRTDEANAVLGISK